MSAPRFDRLVDWEARLNAYLADCAGRPFAWGAHDCALFAAGAVAAMTGVDPAAEFRGRYQTELGAARALRRIGAGTLPATIDRLFATKPPGFARRGDLVQVGEMVGVAIGGEALFVGEEEGRSGLVRFGRAAWVEAWSVG